MYSRKIFNYLALLLLIVTISIISISFKSKNEIKDQSIVKILDGDDEPVYYWFYARIRIDDRTNTYKLTGTTGGLEYGHLIDFEKNLWNSLSKRQIAVGPFQTREEALNAKRLYKSKKDKIKELPEGEIPDRIHWFAITFEQSDRLRIFVIRRAPGAVVTGTVDDFIEAYFEQLEFKLLQIGPFYYYEQAEEAKRFYRMNE